jgi:outer membrane protein OmpA-like peptidoglycan-associated protein
MEIVPQKTANPDIGQARLQKHAISRVSEAKPCQQEDLEITLGSDVFFEPKETELNAEAKKELLQIVGKINIKYRSFHHVKAHVLGYADDFPEDRDNAHIALERAQAVSTYFISNGLRAEALTLEGRTIKDKNNAQGVDRAGRRVEVAITVELR